VNICDGTWSKDCSNDIVLLLHIRTITYEVSYVVASKLFSLLYQFQGLFELMFLIVGQFSEKIGLFGLFVSKIG